jgi:predicted outer membrane protein
MKTERMIQAQEGLQEDLNDLLKELGLPQSQRQKWSVRLTDRLLELIASKQGTGYNASEERQDTPRPPWWR